MSSSPIASPTASIHAANISPDALAAAAERRTRERAQNVQSPAKAAEEHEKRQAFRRLIDPGILRPNAKDQAMASLKTLLTISENLLREPDNPKYQQFKTTNNTIKQRLMDPKGTLEYAIALGFRPEVKNFQPYYTFNPKKIGDLRTGAAILKEVIDIEIEKQERAEKSKKEEKAAIQAAANRVKLAFMDDRQTKTQTDALDKERREALARRRAEMQETSPAPLNSPPVMPGSGFLLGANVHVVEQMDNEETED